MVDEGTGAVGQGVPVLDADADVPVKRLGQGTGHQRIGTAVEHQLLHNADAQPVGHHGQNGLILLDGVLDLRLQAQRVEHRLYLVVIALIQQDQGVLLQRLRRKGVCAGQRVIAGDDDLPLVPLQEPAVQIFLRRGRQADEAAVRLPLQHPVADLVVEVGGQQLKLDAGVVLLKRFEDVGQPLFRHAGECGHLHKTRLQSPQVGGPLLQLVLHGAHLLKIGHQLPAVCRGRNAAVAADQQGHAQLLLQRADGVTDAGLGKVHLPRRRRKAAALHRFQENLIFCHAHGLTLLSYRQYSICGGIVKSIFHGFDEYDAFYKSAPMWYIKDTLRELQERRR